MCPDRGWAVYISVILIVKERGCVVGNDVSEPYGILYASKDAVMGIVSSAACAISLDDVKALCFSLSREHRRSAAWLMNDETALLLRTAPAITSGTMSTIRCAESLCT